MTFLVEVLLLNCRTVRSEVTPFSSVDLATDEHGHVSAEL